MNKYLKLVTTSLACVLIVMFCGIIYGYITRGRLTFIYAFNANFLIGSVLIASGILKLFIPSFKRDKLTDHSTYIERAGEEREARQEKANELLYIGILNVIITGVIQVVLWLIV